MTAQAQPPNTIKLVARVSPELMNDLRRRAETEDRSVAAEVRHVIRSYLNDAGRKVAPVSAPSARPLTNPTPQAPRTE